MARPFVSAPAKLLASAYSVQAVTVATGVLLARGLSVDERGAFALYIAAITLCAGIIAAGTGEFVSLTVRSSSLSLRQILRRVGYLLPHGLLASVLVILAVATPYVDSGTTGPFVIYLLCNLVTATSLGVLLGLGEIGTLSIIRVVNVLMTLASILCLALAGELNLGTCTWVYAVSELATALLTCCAARRTWQKHRLARRERQELGFRTSAARYIPSATVAGIFGSLYERILLIYGDSIGGPSYAGYVAVAIAAIAPITTAGMALVPLSLLAGVEGRQFRSSRSRRRRVASVGALAAGACLYGLALAILVPLVYGQAFEPAVSVAQSLLAGSILLSVARNLSARLRGLGRVGAIVCNDAVAIGVLVAICLMSANLGPWPLAIVWTLATAGSVSLHARTLARVRPTGPRRATRSTHATGGSR